MRTNASKLHEKKELARFKSGALPKPKRSLSMFVSMAVAALAVAAVLLGPTAEASDPGSSNLSPTSGASVSWKGTATGGGALNGAGVAPVKNEDLCVEGTTCDTFTLAVTGTPAEWAGKTIRVDLTFDLPTSDYDLYIHKDTVTGPMVDDSGELPGSPEVAFIDPNVHGVGNYAIRAVYYAATAADQYRATATVIVPPQPTPTPTPDATPVPVSPPRYFVYPAQGGLGRVAGEPTLGVNWETGNVMFVAWLETLRVTFDDAGSPARTSWKNVADAITSARSNDPILFTDSDAGSRRTNRTFVSQLIFPTKQSLMAYTDDDGDTWKPSQGSGINSGVDHQTVGGGPYAANDQGIGPTTSYPHAVYYAAQDIGLAEIARSDDGGFTFGPAYPMWTLAQCGGLHGHIKVAPDGTVYVPNKNCADEEGNPEQGVVVSTDNGQTWSIRTVPGSTNGRTDPSLGIGPDGTIYLGYANGDGKPRVAVSRDRGLTWEHDQDIGAAHGIQLSAFPAVIAGDADRAAYFFLGTTTGGTGLTANAAFTGAWYAYIATTYDGGRSWVTVNATPGDPVQRGAICTSGTTCPSTPVDTRNLLDFNDLTVDKQGRVVAALADGCITNDCIMGKDRNNDGKVDSLDNDGSEFATIIRQAGGKGLFKAYDSVLDSNVPAAPQIVAALDGQAVRLSWSTPDDGGSAITGYKVYRNRTQIASLGPDVNSYTDLAGSAANTYQVRGVNANGDGALSKEVTPTVPETSCKMPGITIWEDTSDLNQNSPPVQQVNLKTLNVAEPYANGASQLTFTLKVGAGDSVPANSQWYIIWQRPTPDGSHDRNYVAMKSDLLGNLSFEHGRVSYPLVYTSPAPNQGNIPTRFGAAQGGYDPRTGTITVVVPTSAVDNPQPGTVLQGVEARSFLGRSDGLPINQNISSDFSPAGFYTVVGNNSCLQAPAAPTDLTGSSRKGEVTLSWRDNSGNETGFVVERSTFVDSGFAPLATLGANATTYTDAAVVRKQTYYYRVVAVNGSARSAPTNVAGVRVK